MKRLKRSPFLLQVTAGSRALNRGKIWCGSGNKNSPHVQRTVIMDEEVRIQDLGGRRLLHMIQSCGHSEYFKFRKILHIIIPSVLFLWKNCVSMIWGMVRVAVCLIILSCLAINYLQLPQNYIQCCSTSCCKILAEKKKIDSAIISIT